MIFRWEEHFSSAEWEEAQRLLFHRFNRWISTFQHIYRGCKISRLSDMSRSFIHIVLPNSTLYPNKSTINEGPTYVRSSWYFVAMTNMMEDWYLTVRSKKKKSLGLLSRLSRKMLLSPQNCYIYIYIGDCTIMFVLLWSKGCSFKLWNSSFFYSFRR